MPSPPKFLAPPPTESRRFDRTFIRNAVCELRFPAILELENSLPPSLHARLRKPYPLYERGRSVGLQLGGTSTTEAIYNFQSKKRDWTVTLKPAAVVLGTEKYDSFEEFSSRIADLLELLLPSLETDFFTRVGLRYTNVLPVKQDELDGWLNPQLSALASSIGVLGTLDLCWQDLQGRTPVGGYLLRHGVRNEAEGKYIIDLDFFSEIVEASDVKGLLFDMHRECFALFAWCLGPKAREHLGPGKVK